MILKIKLDHLKMIVKKLEELEKRLDKQNDINAFLMEKIIKLGLLVSKTTDQDDEEETEEEESDDESPDLTELKEKLKEFDCAIKNLFEQLTK